jgi:hypothetical protein
MKIKAKYPGSPYGAETGLDIKRGHRFGGRAETPCSGGGFLYSEPGLNRAVRYCAKCGVCYYPWFGPPIRKEAFFSLTAFGCIC